MRVRGAATAGLVLGVLVGWVTGGAPSVAGFDDTSTAASTSVSTVDFRPAAPTFGTPTCLAGAITAVEIRWVAGDRRITSYTVSRTAPTAATVATVPDPDSPGQQMTAAGAPNAPSATYRVTANHPYAWSGQSPTATVTC